MNYFPWVCLLLGDTFALERARSGLLSHQGREEANNVVDRLLMNENPGSCGPDSCGRPSAVYGSGGPCYCDSSCVEFGDCCTNIDVCESILEEELQGEIATAVKPGPFANEELFFQDTSLSYSSSSCNEELLEKNPGNPDLVLGALSCSECNGSTVTFTVTQLWQEQSLFCLQTIYKKDGVDYECTEAQKAPFLSAEETFTQTAECSEDGFAYVVLVPRDIGLGIVENEWECTGWGDTTEGYRYSLRIPCDCQGIPEVPDYCAENNLWNKGSEHCNANGVEILNVQGVNPTANDIDILWGIEPDYSTVRVAIRNPFDSEMRTFVRHKEPIGWGPESQLTCTEINMKDCQDYSEEVFLLSCHGVGDTKVSMVEVYFVDVSDSRDDIFGPVEIDECCHANDPPPTSVAQYSIKVSCYCPYQFEGSFRQLRGTVADGSEPQEVL